jgi:hypothetical protein
VSILNKVAVEFYIKQKEIKMKKILLIVCLFWSLQSVAQTNPQATGLVFPNSTANMVVELLRTIMNYGLAELKKAEEKEIKLATVYEENFEVD